MPAVSVDTFFACSLMVIAVLAAMAGASKLLYPYISNNVDQNTVRRYEQISRYMLLNSGKPSSWGQNGQISPETFGLAEDGSECPYELDIDKVSRLNNESRYAVSYADLFTSLKLVDVSFRLEIKPVFEVIVNLTATFPLTNETVYQFELLTEKHGSSVPAELKCYVVAENYLDATSVYTANGKVYQNVTLANNITGPALLIVFARHAFNAKVVSFSVFPFAHNSAEPNLAGTFLKLNPLNHVLNASFVHSGLNLSRAYALTFDYNSTLTQTMQSNESASYGIPRFLSPSPTVVVLTGWNSSVFFAESVAYPQIPLQAGADFAGAMSLSNVFAFTYAVTINSAVYECTVWLGGPGK